jgi:molybdopterin molybdotransferase
MGIFEEVAMIGIEEALSRVLAEARPLGTEKIHISHSLARVLARDISSRRDVPPWTNSAMDGYAVKYEDIAGATRENPARLKIIYDLPAGKFFHGRLERGEAVRIMTGAPLPDGADTVIMREVTAETGDTVAIFEPAAFGSNVRQRGEDIAGDARVLSAGRVIRAVDIGVLASIGVAMVEVYQQPRVAILSTGDEIADLDEDPGHTKIINSNSYSLAALLSELGLKPILLGIARDTREDLRAKLTGALSADVLLTSGGVSVGDYDYVKEILAELGFKPAFWQVRIKPGKPLTFGLIGRQAVFGLPGNPASVVNSFELFVRPFLLKMQGHSRIFRATIRARLTIDLANNVNRITSLRVALRRLPSNEIEAVPLKAQGSGMLSSMTHSHGIILLPAETTWNRGIDIPVYLFDPAFLDDDTPIFYPEENRAAFLRLNPAEQPVLDANSTNSAIDVKPVKP